MKKVLLVILIAFGATLTQAQKYKDVYQFKVNLNQVIDDKIEVELQVPKTVRKQKVVRYHLPKIVPGTYSVYNFGRFVTKFTAYKKNGKPFKTKYITHPDDNTWVIRKAKKLYKITYTIEDTWDTKKDAVGTDDYIFEPGGTNIEENKNFTINNHGFFGYFDGFKYRDFYITVDRPQNFFGATSLIRTGGDADTDIFHAPNYMDLADAPMMFCEPDTAIIKVGDANVLIATYSPNGKVKSDFIAGEVSPILQAHKAYLGGKLPVDRYAFLIYLADGQSMSGKYGALEHSYSSLYYLPEMEPQQIAQTIRDVAAHEFYHIVTPLNIHSEEIGNFDFINPKMSKHLWLYEGVTEYSAGHVQVVEKLQPIETYLKVIEGKIRGAAKYKDDLPFTVMSRLILGKHKKQYANVYEKGALIGMCLDIKLRELSGGKYGIQDLVRDLSKEYGITKSFKDDELFDVIVGLTYPEIGDFLKTYVAGPTTLPIQELLAKTGIQYYDKKESADISMFGGNINKYIGYQFAESKFYIKDGSGLDEFGTTYIGFKEGDVIEKWNGEALTIESINKVLGVYAGTVKEGADLKISIIRNGEKMDLETKITPVMVEKEHVLELSENPTEGQLKLRKAWLGDYKTKADFQPEKKETSDGK